MTSPRERLQTEEKALRVLSSRARSQGDKEALAKKAEEWQ